MIDMLISISELVSHKNPKFIKFTNKKLLFWHLYKLKLRYIALNQGLNIPQLFKVRSLFQF